MHSLRITSSDDGLRDGAEIEVPVHIVRAEPLVRADEGIRAFAASHADAETVSLWRRCMCM